MVEPVLPVLPTKLEDQTKFWIVRVIWYYVEYAECETLIRYEELGKEKTLVLVDGAFVEKEISSLYRALVLS
jgi:hypothetical protein